MRINPENLYIFGCVVEAKSFSGAADNLRMSRSSISKDIRKFEGELGVVLFNRSTRRISLTDAGHVLYQHWRSIAGDLDTAFAAIQGLDQRPSGNLRVSMPSSLGTAMMPRIMQNFCAERPNIKLSIDFSDHSVDIVGQGFDIAIRLASRLPNSRLTAKRLASTEQVLAASPAYLQRNGVPKQLEDLRDYSTLTLGYRSQDKMVWSFNAREGPVDIGLRAAFAANNDLALILAACLDGGILYKPRLLIESEIRLGRLKTIRLNALTGTEYGVFAVYPQSKPPAKARVFAEFVKASLDELAKSDRWAPLHA